MLSENEAFDLAMKQLIQDLPHGRYQITADEVRAARNTVRALLPHLSDTSSEKARVEGLVGAAKALSLNYNYCCDGAEVVVFAGGDEVIYHGNNKDGEGNGKAFKAIKDFTEALAAFDKGE